MKKIIPHKLIIEFDNKSFKDGIFLYRVGENGAIDKQYKSISIKNLKFNKLHLANILEVVKKHIAKIEKAEED